MDTDKSRRNFLTRDIFLRGARLLTELANAFKEPQSQDEKEDYFDSFEHCYPLLSEAGELLMEEAARRGIPVEGKTRMEIAREIFSSEKVDAEDRGKGGEMR
jgi:hypothetical protein